MSHTRITVTCSDCSFERVFDRLSAARVALDDHERTTGHTIDWTIGALSAGVERAGEEAGVCGIPGSSADDSLLVHPIAPDHDAGERRLTDRR